MDQDRRFGLCQVYPDASDHEATADKKVDIIFMHGLDAESPRTWIAWKKDDDPDSGDVNWLSDKHMLPSSMPDARILTYDWNANYDTTASGDRFLGHADTLLDRVYVNREHLNRLRIPLIFVASCFSGLLLAKALVRATERYHPRGPKYRQVLDFTVGVAFLGTPFSGSWGTGYTVADLRVAVAIESGGEYNRDLMEYLRQGTSESPGPLDDLVQTFSEMIHHTDFKFGKVCFYETRHTNFSAYRKKLPKDYAAQLDIDGHGIVVTKSSACLQGVEGVALDVRHNMLHKFNSPENDGYQRLVSRLKDFAENAHVVLGVDDECNYICEPRDRSPSDKDGSSSFTKKLTLFKGYNDAYLGANVRLEEKEERGRRTRCLQSLYFDGIDYEPSKIREPGQTACQWLLKHSSYLDWHKNGRGILWILGNPGSGKSTLIKHAIHSCREDTTEGAAYVLSFFFHNQGQLLQHTTEGLLRSLLHQLLEKFPEQTSALTERFDARKTKKRNRPKWKTADLMLHLRACLKKVVESFNIRIFVDALDECTVGEEEVDDETEEIRDLIRNLQDINQELSSSPKKLSICFACRHYPNLARPGVDDRISAEQGNRADIEEFVHQELVRELPADESKDLRESLEKEILRSADGNFLWATLVTPRAIEMCHSGKPEPLEEVQRIPKKITHIYETTITALLKENPAISLRLLQWICFAIRPLDIQELRWAINTVPNPLYESFEDIPGPFWGKTDEEMERLIPSLSGGLAKVDNSKKVVFIHVSVKDYLLRSGFHILDSDSHTSQDIVKTGHDVLLEACLWVITTSDFGDPFETWMESFSKPIIRIALGAILPGTTIDPGVYAILDKYPLAPGENPRIKVDVMDRSDRRYMHQCLNPNNVEEFLHGYQQKHRQTNYTGELEEWLVTDEMLSCLLGFTALLQGLSLHQIRLTCYFHQYWHDHALQSLSNGSESVVNKSLDNFFCRAQKSLFYFYCLIGSVLQRAAGLPNSIILSGILIRDKEEHFPVNSPSFRTRITALMEASAMGHQDNVRILLQQEGIQVDLEDSNGETALLKAVRSKSKLIVELLVNHNANVDHQDHEGATALIHSVRNKLDGIIEILLQHGASTQVKDYKGLTAFDYAIDKGNFQLCRHVLGHATQSERLDLADRKRMVAACKNGHSDIVRLFLENGARTEIPESQAQSNFPFSESALGVAIAADQRAVLEILLDHESTHSGLPVWRTNLLCESVRQRAIECMKSLIVHYGWEIDKADANGDMPIDVAIREGWASHLSPNPFYNIIKTLVSLDQSPKGIVMNTLNSHLQSQVREQGSSLVHHHSTLEQEEEYPLYSVIGLLGLLLPNDDHNQEEEVETG